MDQSVQELAGLLASKALLRPQLLLHVASLMSIHIKQSDQIFFMSKLAPLYSEQRSETTAPQLI